MKKLSFLVLALLLGLSTSVFARECAESPEPNAGGPENCVTSVYNNSGAALDDGDVVIWDMDSATGDDDNWVNTTTTADTYIVAGVVEGSIGVAQNGIITIRGFTNVDTITGAAQSVDGQVCTSTVAGSARSCSDNAASFGTVVTAAASNSANVCVKCGSNY